MFQSKKTPSNASAASNSAVQSDDELAVSTEALRRKLDGNADVIFENIIVSDHRDNPYTLVFIDGMVNEAHIDDFVLKPLIQEDGLGKLKTEQSLVDFIMLGTVYHCQRKLRDKLPDCLDDLLGGSVVMIFDRLKTAVTFELKGFEKRGLTEPTNENVLKGSKEAFIEVLRVNTALIRRRIRTSDLKINELTLGRRSHTSVAVVYLQGVANESIVTKVRERLAAVDIDGIVSAGQLESNLQDNKYTFFPQVIYTERVDKLCANILEGRIAILSDGLPLAYIVPVDLNSFLQAPEDYALNYISSSLFRLLRHICAFAALILPAFYVSITEFHQEMIPAKLATSIIENRQGVPFPTFLEVIFMLLAFEVLLEAGLRLPRAVGQAVSIVGAIIIGQAAISAHILSPGVVIIISTAGVSGFVIPSQDLSNAIRVCRFILVLLATVAGLFMVTIGLIIILYHLNSLEIFGVPYFSPYTASEGRGVFSDTFIRRPWFNAKKRPQNIGPADPTREGSQIGGGG